MRRRTPAAGAAENDELDRLCDQLGRVETPFDEITRSRAEARLGAALASEPARRWRARGWVVGLIVAGAAACGVLVARNVVPAARSRIAGRSEPAPRFQPYVVAPAGGATAGNAPAASAVPEALVQPSSRLDVPAGWLMRASLGDAISVTLAGPARAWSESAVPSGRTVIHLAEGRLLASLEGGAGRRLEIVSPGAVTDVVGTLFSVEVVGGASRVAVAHGRVQVSAPPDASGTPREPRQIAAGESWLTTQPEPDALDPALADALADHERTPPPRGIALPLSVTESPAGTGVWVGKRRVATAPAWVLVEPRAAVRLSAPARPAAPPPDLPLPPAEAPSPPPEPLAHPTRRTTLAWAMEPPRPRPQDPSPSAALTQPPALAPAPLAPEEVTAQTLFRQADAARATGDTKLALYALRTLVERFPHDRATAPARYELALMEQATRDGQTALRDLAAVDSPSLEEPAEYLRCRVLAKQTAAGAERCLADFRRRFPSSAHDADALAAEAALALSRGGCRAAETAREELERRYPAHGSVARLRAACPEALERRSAAPASH